MTEKRLSNTYVDPNIETNWGKEVKFFPLRLKYR